MAARLALAMCRFCLAAKSERAAGALIQASAEPLEAYAEILKDTFNVELAGISGQCDLCPKCISRLMDARDFKLQVLSSEERFAKILSEAQTNIISSRSKRLLRSRAKLKTASEADSEQEESGDELGHMDDAFAEDQSCDETLVEVKAEPAADGAAPTRSKRRSCQAEVAKRLKVEAEELDETDTVEHRKKLTDRRGNAPILRENSLKLLANSTMCIFQWHKSRYRCFCCNEPFTTMDSLRHHTYNAHTLKNIEKKIILQQNRLVKVEISTLDCKICGQAVQSINNLKQHLANEHKVHFTLKEDLLVPFKLNTDSLQCQICSENFSVFRHLNIHMNRHYQKQVCHICGAGFSNLVYLNLHKTRSHRPLKCGECQMEFFSRADKREHDTTIHNVKIERKLRFPCPFCNERYFQEHLRILHLVEKHGLEKPQHVCSICGKVYVTKSLRNNHLKNVHMKQKNRECEVCQLRFYTKSDLKRHKVTHTGEKNFPCGSCTNLYATKDSLNRHVKRTHNV